MDSSKLNFSTTVLVSSKGPSSQSNHAGDESYLKKDTKHSRFKKCLGDSLLTVATLLGVALGIGSGLGLRYSKTWIKREVMYLNFCGELFLNMLKCLVLPLVVSNLVAAVGSLDTKISGKIGLRTISYYIATTILAIILGVILVVTIQPGVSKSGNIEESKKKENFSLPEDKLMDLLRNIFPPNIMEATLVQRITILLKPKNWTKPANETTSADLRLWDVNLETRQQSNILGMVLFSIVLGVTLAKMKQRGKPLLDVFISLSDAIMTITNGVTWLSPVGVLFLIASKVVAMDDLSKVVAQVGMYGVTVMCGLFIHGFVVVPLIYFLILRKSPFPFIFNMGQALATAFGTSSSAATLPVTLSCAEKKNSIDPRIARFCLPIGATINMDGTALYEAIAAIFIGQVRGRELGLGNIFAISIASTAGSIGAAGIPQAGFVSMIMVLNVAGLPAEDVALLMMVDWILDRFRTVINILGDAFGAAIVDHLSQKDMKDMTDEDLSNIEMASL